MHEHIGESDKCYVKSDCSTFLSMDGFDILAMGISLFDPSNALVEFN